MSKVSKTPAPKDWNQAIAVLEQWRGETHQVTDALKIQLEAFRAEFHEFRTESRRDIEMFKNGGADFSQRLLAVTNDVKAVKLTVEALKADVGVLKTDNATFFTRLTSLESKVGLA